MILTDSLSLPRVFPEKCKFEDTYPYLLRRMGLHVHQVSIGGATSDTLVSQLHYHLPFNPKIIILQVGIVDCAPRFARKSEVFL